MRSANDLKTTNISARSSIRANAFVFVLALTSVLILASLPLSAFAKDKKDLFDSIQVQMLFDDNRVTAQDPSEIGFTELDAWEGIDDPTPRDPNRLRSKSFDFSVRASKSPTESRDSMPNDETKNEKPTDCVKCNLNQNSLSSQAQGLGDIRNALNAQYEKDLTREPSRTSSSSDEQMNVPVRATSSKVTEFQKRLIANARKEGQQRCRTGSDGRICRDGSKGLCLQAVREAVQESAGEPNKTWTKNAKDAGPYLQNYGMTNAIRKYPNAAEVPLGAVLVYAGGPSGHIEVFTGQQYCSDYCSTRPRSDAGTRRLIGVYVPH